MDIFLAVLASLLFFAMVGTKTNDNKRLYSYLFVITIAALVVVHWMGQLNSMV